MYSTLVLAVVLGGGLDQSRDDPADVRPAVQKALTFLQDDSLSWIAEYSCATCHHAPMTIWVAAEAKRRGFELDTEALDEIVQFTFDDPVKSKLLPGPSAEREQPPAASESFSLFTAYGAIAASAHVRANRDASDGVRALPARLAAYLRETQRPEGTWFHGGGKAPILESQEITTLMSLFAIARAESVGADGGSPKSAPALQRNAAVWLELTPSGSLQARALRLLLALETGGSSEDIKIRREELINAQNSDGGWSQTPAMKSDAFATGQVLYVLARAGVDGRDPVFERARSFLVSTQNDDGDWPMISRSTAATPVPAKNLRPITAAATAWAALGLLESLEPLAP